MAIKTALNITLVYGDLRQKNDEFKTSLGYTEKPYFREVRGEANLKAVISSLVSSLCLSICTAF